MWIRLTTVLLFVDLYTTVDLQLCLLFVFYRRRCGESILVVYGTALTENRHPTIYAFYGENSSSNVAAVSLFRHLFELYSVGACFAIVPTLIV